MFKRKGLNGLLFDTDIVKPEYIGEFVKLIKSNANFFKHADKDPDAEKEFDPTINIGIMMITIYGLRKLGRQMGDIENTFINWLAIHKRNYFTEKTFADKIPVDQLQQIRSVSRKEFFDGYEIILKEQARERSL